MSDAPNDQQAKTHLDIASEPDEVWEALTSTDRADCWHGEGSIIGDEEGDTLYIVDPATGRPKSGIVETLIPDERFTYTWWPVEEPDEASHVTITLEPIPIGTRVTVVERPLTPGTAQLRGQLAMVGR